MSRRSASRRRGRPPRVPPLPVEIADALGEDLRTLETLADLLVLAGDELGPTPRTLHGLALTIGGACDRMRGAIGERA